MNRSHWEGLTLLIVLAAVGAVLALLFLPFTEWVPSAETERWLARPEGAPAVNYFPPQPEDAGEPLREWVLLGAHMMGRAPTNGWFGKKANLTCSSCHFNGGITPGGRNGGISLVGAAARYPRGTAAGPMLTLAGRVNECLRRNLNAPSLAADSREMLAVCAYLQWVSKDTPVYAEVPWLGLPHVESGEAEPNEGQGARLFTLRCGMCHGPDGQGTEIAPSLWGPHSFTHASAMNDPRRLTAFLHQNMPRSNPLLDPPEAATLSAYILARPRPAAWSHE